MGLLLGSTTLVGSFLTTLVGAGQQAPPAALQVLLVVA